MVKRGAGRGHGTRRRNPPDWNVSVKNPGSHVSCGCRCGSCGGGSHCNGDRCNIR